MNEYVFLEWLSILHRYSLLTSREYCAAKKRYHKRYTKQTDITGE